MFFVREIEMIGCEFIPKYVNTTKYQTVLLVSLTSHYYNSLILGARTTITLCIDILLSISKSLSRTYLVTSVAEGTLA